MLLAAGGGCRDLIPRRSPAVFIPLPMNTTIEYPLLTSLVAPRVESCISSFSDPEQAVSVWRQFAGWKSSKTQVGQPVFTSTHPVDETCFHELQAFMSTAKLSQIR